jgi:hypothetical protein
MGTIHSLSRYDGPYEPSKARAELASASPRHYDENHKVRLRLVSSGDGGLTLSWAVE